MKDESLDMTLKSRHLVERWARRRQAKAYRTSVDVFLLSWVSNDVTRQGPQAWSVSCSRRRREMFIETASL